MLTKMFRIKVSKSDLSDLDVLSDYLIRTNPSQRPRFAFHRGWSCLRLDAGGQRAVPFIEAVVVVGSCFVVFTDVQGRIAPDGILWLTDEYAVELRLAAALPAACRLQ